MTLLKELERLKVSSGNAKLTNRNIFSIPAGLTCPKAKLCKSWAKVINGQSRIIDSETTLFRCYAASQENQYPVVRDNRMYNFKAILKALRRGNAVELIDKSIDKNLKLTRIHESGDFFSLDYLKAWLEVARKNPENIFYCYSKSLSYFLDLGIPNNFYMVASWGGYEDHLIEYFERDSRVVFNEDEANKLNLPIDHDDSNCLKKGKHSFCHLLHGTQPKNSEASKELSKRRKLKKNNKSIFTGYSK